MNVFKVLAHIERWKIMLAETYPWIGNFWIQAYSYRIINMNVIPFWIIQYVSYHYGTILQRSHDISPTPTQRAKFQICVYYGFISNNIVPLSTFRILISPLNAMSKFFGSFQNNRQIFCAFSTYLYPRLYIVLRLY